MKQKNNFLGKLKRYRVLLLMLLPAVLYVILFNYIPLAHSTGEPEHLNREKGVTLYSCCSFLSRFLYTSKGIFFPFLSLTEKFQ